MKGFIGRRGWTSLKVMNEKKRKRDIKISWRKITPNYRAVVSNGKSRIQKVIKSMGMKQKLQQKPNLEMLASRIKNRY